MKSILEVATQGFWQFIGVLTILSLICQFIYGIIHKVIRAININKHGYPPVHCDGDGDAYKD